MEQNISTANFDQQFRAQVAGIIKSSGIKRAEKSLLAAGYTPSFSRAIIRSIIRREGW